MGLKDLFKRPAKPGTPRYRREMAERICGHHIKYVSEMRGETDEVIGREGGLNIRNGEFIVFASSDIIFRTNVDELDAWELLSKDGVVLTGPDYEHGGAVRTIIVHFTYYIK